MDILEFQIEAMRSIDCDSARVQLDTPPHVHDSGNQCAPLFYTRVDQSNRLLYFVHIISPTRRQMVTSAQISAENRPTDQHNGTNNTANNSNSNQFLITATKCSVAFVTVLCVVFMCHPSSVWCISAWIYRQLSDSVHENHNPSRRNEWW